MSSFVHPALFYRGPEEYLAGTVPFIREGLADGGAVAVAVPGPNLALLRAALGAVVARVRLVDMSRAGRNPARIIPGVLRAFADAHRDAPVRIIGEPIWPGRTPVEYPACVQHEALINVAFAGRTVTILCPYDAAHLDERVLEDAAMTHPTIVDSSGQRVSPAYAPDRVIAAYNQPLAPSSEVDGLAFTLDTLAEARRFVTAHARRCGLSAGRTLDLEVAVNELMTNSIVHGAGGGTVAVWATDGQFVCEVRDAGHLKDLLAGSCPVPVDALGGRGLLLVNHLADLVRTYRSEDGTTTRLHLDLA